MQHNKLSDIVSHATRDAETLRASRSAPADSNPHNTASSSPRASSSNLGVSSSVPPVGELEGGTVSATSNTQRQTLDSSSATAWQPGEPVDGKQEFEYIDAAALVKEAKNKAFSSGKLRGFKLLLGVVAAVALVSLPALIASNASSRTFIVAALVVIAALLGWAIKLSWDEKQEAQQRYEDAVAIFEAVKEKKAKDAATPVPPSIPSVTPATPATPVTPDPGAATGFMTEQKVANRAPHISRRESPRPSSTEGTPK